MAFNELIKNFDNIRQLMRDFYVFGFKSRADFADKSARSYDNERRRIESWLCEYMYFRQNAGGKNCFISMDSRVKIHPPSGWLLLCGFSPWSAIEFLFKEMR